MSGETGNRVTDRPLEQDLEPIRSAWRELQRDEPPQLLDQSVRNAARRALPDRNRRSSLRWLGSLATAAVVVLALAIVIRQDQQGPVPPALETDGFQLDTRSKRSEKMADEGVAADAAPGPAELRLERAAPAAANDSRQELDATTMPPVLLENEAAAPGPDAWIDRMLQLQQAGRLDELTAELAAFRKAYPEHPLPPELRE